MTEEPLAHIFRTRLPWRNDTYTECGRHETDVRSIITRDELKKRLNKWGHKRTAFTVCMTCMDRSKYNDTWELSPIAVLRRECERVGYYQPYGDGPRSQQHHRLANELHAITALIEAHRDEFDGYLAGLDDTISLDAKRRHLKAVGQPRKPPPRPTRPDIDPQPL